VVLPTFRDDAAAALAVARQAEEAGVDGVFCFDHLWPLGQPWRPALAPFPVLGAVARETARVCVGTLVARIGLVPDEVLVSEFLTLERAAPGRVIAGMGTGDHLSAAENDAYGVPPSTAKERVEALERCARAVQARGIPVWLGGRNRGTRAVAEAVGTAVNLWSAPVPEVAAQSRRTEVTWAGPVSTGGGAEPAGGADRATDGAEAGAETGADAETEAETVTSVVHAMARAGATWVVFAWPCPLATLAAAGRR
jgi:alkanesulfonate monooxygenase SsuD/methylene tetrahydromethanopterin reductase-like flavin-dependent oxidoreductase (luciferase family)